MYFFIYFYKMLHLKKSGLLRQIQILFGTQKFLSNLVYLSTLNNKYLLKRISPSLTLDCIPFLTQAKAEE